MNTQRRLQMIHAVAFEADQFYTKAEELGKVAAEAFGKRQRSQMTNLQSVANNALKVSDVLDFIKTRTARSEKDKNWRKNKFGQYLLEFIRKTLKSVHLKRVCHTLAISTDTVTVEKQQVYLHLIRAFVGQLVAQYEYHALRGEVWS